MIYYYYYYYYYFVETKFKDVFHSLDIWHKAKSIKKCISSCVTLDVYIYTYILLSSFSRLVVTCITCCNLSSYLTRTFSADYEQLCSLDVLGLEDKADRNQQSVYEELKEQLRQSAEGWYETGLLWKHGHEPLPNNKQGSLRRLGNLGKKLQREPNLLDGTMT